MRNCANLIKAIDAFLVKADDNLKDALDEAGFVESSSTVEEINKVEEKVAEALKEETGYVKSKMKKAVDLDAFAADWPEIKAGDTVDRTIEEIFIDEFKTQMPKLATAYTKRIDPALTVTNITKRTTSWAQSWSSELGRLMKLTTHNEVERLLVKHLKDGKSVADLTKAFMDSGIRNEYYRARSAALTEMLRAHSVAQQESLTQNAAATNKEWVHSGAYRNEPRPNHVALSGTIVPKDQPFMLYGADGGIYYPMYPRDSALPVGESINCHCIHRGIVDESVLGLSIEERRRLQQEAIDADDGAWEKELDAKNRAKAGIDTETQANSTIYNPGKTGYNNKGGIKDYGFTDTSDRMENDLLSLHTASDGGLTIEREVLHRQILDDIYVDVSPVKGQATFTVMGGGSAAGKSTMIKSGAVVLPENSVMIDSDAIKTKLPEYQAMTAAGDRSAAGFAHEESSALAKRALGIANTNNYNVTLDGTGDGSQKSLEKKILDAKAAGMKVKGVYATVPTDVAVERSTARAAKTGREVPIKDIRRIHQKVSEILPKSAHLFDYVEVYDTTNDAILIATGGNGEGLKPVPGQESLFEAFLEKANE